LKTFTIGFEEGYNEAPFAKRTAEYLGTEHHEYICTSKEAQAIIPTLPYFYDEPFADTSAIPTILVSQFARRQVKVALSADGGDELFGGYESYSLLAKKLDTLNRIPVRIKGHVKSVLSVAEKVIPSFASGPKHKVKGFADALDVDVYQQAAKLFSGMNGMPRSFNENIFAHSMEGNRKGYTISERGFNHEIEVAMAVDYQRYLPNDILTKVDRATMSVSLEGREPLLDHRLAEFVIQLPFEFKATKTTSKKILKDIVHGYIPKEMMDRPKKGFSLPIYDWLRNDLSYLIEEYLNDHSLKTSGLFNVPFVSNQVHLFKKGRLHYKPFIWKMLMFQMWWDRWMK